MSKFKIQVNLKSVNGLTLSYDTEVDLPNHLDSKITNSNYKGEIIQALNGVLPQMLGGSDWRKNGAQVIGFNNVRKQ